MSKKNNNVNPFKELASLITAIAVVIKWFIETITYFLVQLARFIKWLDKKLSKPITKNKITEKPFENIKTNHKEKEQITKESILLKLNLFNTDIYNDIFPPQIKSRGE